MVSLSPPSFQLSKFMQMAKTRKHYNINFFSRYIIQLTAYLIFFDDSSSLPNFVYTNFLFLRYVCLFCAYANDWVLRVHNLFLKRMIIVDNRFFFFFYFQTYILEFSTCLNLIYIYIYTNFVNTFKIYY